MVGVGGFWNGVRRGGACALGLASGLILTAGLSTEGRADALCDDPGTTCQAALPPACLQKFGAGAISSGDAACGAAFGAYRDCLADAAARCGGPATPAAGGGDAAQDDRAKRAWDAVKTSTDPEELELVAKAYPGTFWAELAAKRAASLRSTTAAPAPEAQAERRRVRAAQERLTAGCFYFGEIDGVWGASAGAALNAFLTVAGAPKPGPALSPEAEARLRRDNISICTETSRFDRAPKRLSLSRDAPWRLRCELFRIQRAPDKAMKAQRRVVRWIYDGKTLTAADAGRKNRATARWSMSAETLQLGEKGFVVNLDYGTVILVRAQKDGAFLAAKAQCVAE